MKLDILFINANSSEVNYQDLAKFYSAIETPIWAGMLANSVRSKKYLTAILDCEAERIDTADSAKRICELRPRIACFVVYGQNPNDGSPRMEGAVATSRLVKQIDENIKILFVGPHMAALPREVLATEDSVDFICQNEGVYTIHNLLKVTNLNDENLLSKVKGLGYRSKHFKKANFLKLLETNLESASGIILNEPEEIVPKKSLEQDLPGIAWDLLPNITSYRTSGWHSWSNNCEVSPFASVYTSLGCPYKCQFCMINIINRKNNAIGIASDDSNIFRFWNPDFMIQQFDKLAEMGIKNIKIADELFVLNPNHFLTLSKLIIERGYNFNIWCYSRVDTCKPAYLETLKKAGVNWLALGIENPNQSLRREFVKGGFEEIKVVDLIKNIRGAGINIIGNYIYGLPPDTHESMKETLDFALSNLTEAFNIYPAQALPGSPLYLEARKEGWKLPDRYAGYSMLSYYTQNTSNKQLTAQEILKARDQAFMIYHKNTEYLKMLETKFGIHARMNVESMTKISLKRKILGD
jgi:anaerobic magnesium-protoporphyrin IX monomethyl ester cyclase